MDKISVVIPVYKVEKYLDECILSIINQTYKNLEIILVDDGSPDKCGEICDNYSKIDNRIVVIHKENGGLSDARNVGIEIATGNYISFIDSDDYVNLKYFEILYNNIKKYDADVSICSYLKFYDGENLNNDDNINYYNNKQIEKKEALYNLYGKNRQNYVVAWGKLFDISLFNSLRFPKNKIHEDSFITYKIYINSKKIIYTNNKLYFYRQRENSIMTYISEKRLDDIESIEEQIKFYKDNNMNEIYIESIKYYSMALGTFYERFKKVNNYNICKKINFKRNILLKNIKKMNLDRFDRDYIKAPWSHSKYIELYWLVISIRNKILNYIIKE